MSKLEFEVVTPERRVVHEKVDEVVLPSLEGYLGVLPGHAPLLSQLDIGEISFRVGNERKYLTVSGGFAEVLRGSVSVLARTAEFPEEIDLERAEKARADAEKRLKTDLAGEEFVRTEVRLKRAMNRIQLHGRLRG